MLESIHLKIQFLSCVQRVHKKEQFPVGLIEVMSAKETFTQKILYLFLLMEKVVTVTLMCLHLSFLVIVMFQFCSPLGR
ncbi:hypothetical protein AKG38_11545 [Pectobacterium carotovorum subsp. carotovorum]|nr:hypothetical protein [Pectobacterium carotovorum subsp. carotovorum]